MKKIKDEFQLIQTYFKSIDSFHPGVEVGIGDDAAIVSIPSTHDLVITTDTLVAGCHFYSDCNAYDIAYKAVMVNLSDLAAMGGEPAYASLALTIPDADEAWLEAFANGLKDALAQYKVSLIGGDTTKGPLSITLTMHGLCIKGKSIKRSGAKVGDIIYVTGDLGSAAFALSQNYIPCNDNVHIMEKLLHPHPRFDFRELLLQYATACIDISDGLAQDLNHICKGSSVGAKIYLSQIPVDEYVKSHDPNFIDLALNGGDDYELCFTVQNNEDFLKKARELKLNPIKIGVITKSGFDLIDKLGKSLKLHIKGYKHF